MAWKASFTQGVSSFKALRLDEALNQFSIALKEQGGDKQYIIYDSRAAVYEKLNMPKEALRDARNVIALAQDQWHGYARSARLFLLARKFDASLKMANMALDRVKIPQSARHEELVELKNKILAAQQDEEKQRRATQNQFEKLPVELVGEMFHLLVSSDVAELIVILHTCRYWRAAAWSNPMLWERLVLTPKSPVRKLRLWLNQSKGRIRELYIRKGVTSHVDWPFPELAQLPWDRLRVCSAFAWHVAQYLQTAKLKCRDDDVFAGLESFEIVETYARQQSITAPPWPLLKKAGIRSLSFSRSPVSWEHLSNLESLTMLNIQYGSTGLQDLLPTLKANSGLEKLTILEYFSYKWNTETDATHLPNLKDLVFRGGWSSSLLQNLRLPSLELLSIRDSPNLDVALRTLATDSTPLNLTHLTLHSTFVAPNILFGLLKHSPMLVHLALVSIPVGVNAVIEGLARSAPSASQSHNRGEEPNIICSRLTHLDVSHSQDVRTGPLVRLIKARLPPALNLTEGDGEPQKTYERILELTLDGCEQIEADWLPWFRKHVPLMSCVFQSKKKTPWAL